MHILIETDKLTLWIINMLLNRIQRTITHHRTKSWYSLFNVIQTNYVIITFERNFSFFAISFSPNDLHPSRCTLIFFTIWLQRVLLGYIWAYIYKLFLLLALSHLRYHCWNMWWYHVLYLGNIFLCTTSAINDFHGYLLLSKCYPACNVVCVIWNGHVGLTWVLKWHREVNLHPSSKQNDRL